jgi:hypothetical protein
VVPQGVCDHFPTDAVARPDLATTGLAEPHGHGSGRTSKLVAELADEREQFAPLSHRDAVGGGQDETTETGCGYRGYELVRHFGAAHGRERVRGVIAREYRDTNILALLPHRSELLSRSFQESFVVVRDGNDVLRFTYMPRPTAARLHDDERDDGHLVLLGWVRTGAGSSSNNRALRFG